ncbi:DUF3800 domain-containing protein [Actinomyces faecalis]|uniref:DUF3800 domain-containing protein n=1 Tax=Actinomyces faecalis TaxID=2722820 RepID=UPI0015551504|nr:DUF3800 domain-containing protein [Actinomyces faecalis]
MNKSLLSRPASAGHVRLPRHTSAPTFFLDESGSKGSGGRFFVVAAVKVADPDKLLRGIEGVRQARSFRTEFKFSNVTRNALPAYEALADVIAESSATCGAFVVDKAQADPFATGLPQWKAHNWTSVALVKAMVSRREIATVLTDSISTPDGTSYGAELRAAVNDAFRCMRVATALSLDSLTCDGLQAADLIASAIAHERKAMQDSTIEEFAARKTPKAQLSRYVATRLGLANFNDCRTERVRIRTAASVPSISIDRESL